jgi:hypothetical protein
MFLHLGHNEMPMCRRTQSTPQLFVSITNTSEYWIGRRSLSSGGHSADPLAGDDG